MPFSLMGRDFSWPYEALPSWAATTALHGNTTRRFAPAARTRCYFRHTCTLTGTLAADIAISSRCPRCSRDERRRRRAFISSGTAPASSARTPFLRLHSPAASLQLLLLAAANAAFDRHSHGLMFGRASPALAAAHAGDTRSFLENFASASTRARFSPDFNHHYRNELAHENADTVR